MTADQPHHSFDVVIAGGGVAALEATLALRDLAGDLVEVTLVSPTDRFTFAPASVGVPFGKSVVRQFDLFRIANDLGVRLVVGAVTVVSRIGSRVHPCGYGSPLAYRALLIACGAAAPSDTGAVTFRGPADVDSTWTLLGEVADGSVDRLLFAMPASLGWTLPLYQLCLLHVAIWSSTTTSTTTPTNWRRSPPQIGLVTPKRPRSKRLEARPAPPWSRCSTSWKVVFHPGQTPVRFHDGLLKMLPGGGLTADPAPAMPRLEGTQITGITVDSEGFIRTDLSSGWWTT